LNTLSSVGWRRGIKGEEAWIIRNPSTELRHMLRAAWTHKTTTDETPDLLT
jgi:hypothetical protein